MGVSAGEQRRVVLSFSIPYPTSWGQSVIVYGASAVLGGWDAKRGHSLTCKHEGEALIWEARVHVLAHSEVCLKRRQAIVLPVAADHCLAHTSGTQAKGVYCSDTEL